MPKRYFPLATSFIVNQISEFHFAVLGPNPDAGKDGVCYSGKLLTICTTDGREDAARIAFCLNAVEAMEDKARRAARMRQLRQRAA